MLWDKYCWFGGDMLFLFFDGALYPYEGIQIATPYDLKSDERIVNGVRVQATAPHRITHFYVHDGGKMSYINQAKSDFRRVRQNQGIFAPSKHWRPAMLRGVPDLHAVVDALQDWDETNDNVAGLIKLQSMIWTVEQKGGVGNMPGGRFIATDSTKGEQVEYTKADHGMRIKTNGRPADVFGFNHLDNPGQQHVPYMEYSARRISAGTGIPYEIVMHIYTSGSYTANRAARLDFAKFIMGRWAWRNKVLNQRVWNWATAKAIKNRDLPPAPVDERGVSEWYKCSWTLPHFPHIDEGKEVVADIKQWGCGQESLEDWAQQRGKTRTQLLDAHDADIEAMKERAEKLGIPIEQYMGGLFKGAPTPGGSDAVTEA